jgi:DNA-binding CsgD family transcriptional regulator
MLSDLIDNLITAWNRIRPRLLVDGDELARRVARRGTSQVTRPARACCIAVRASDRRISACNAILDPSDAADVDREGRHVDPVAHRVTIDAQLLVELGGGVDLTMWRGQHLNVAAAKLGVSPTSLGYQRAHGMVKCDRIFGLGGRQAHVPLVWNDRVSDPNASNGHAPPDEVWGNAWRRLAGSVPEDFSQALEREPAFRRDHRDGHGVHRGWRWVCPKCEARVRSIYLPRPAMTIVEWLGDREVLDKIAGTDAVRPVDATFACVRCHRVRYFTSLTDASWNQMIATLSGGLLYGSEVERPAEFQQKRKRIYATHAAEHPRADELERLLISGKTYAQAADAMGVTLSTVQGHVRRLYRRRGVHSRRALAMTLAMR